MMVVVVMMVVMFCLYRLMSEWVKLQNALLCPVEVSFCCSWRRGGQEMCSSSRSRVREWKKMQWALVLLRLVLTGSPLSLFCSPNWKLARFAKVNFVVSFSISLSDFVCLYSPFKREARVWLCSIAVIATAAAVAFNESANFIKLSRF